jgi:hypothetical protein
MKYFLNLVVSYPRITSIGLFIYTALSLLKLIWVDEFSIVVSLSAVVGYALMILILKVWLVAFFRDSIFKQLPSKFPWSFVLVTFIVLALSVAALAPMLGQYV